MAHRGLFGGARRSHAAPVVVMTIVISLAFLTSGKEKGGEGGSSENKRFHCGGHKSLGIRRGSENHVH